MKAQYSISKSYEGRPGKNVINYFTGTFEECKQDIRVTALAWRRNGGIILKETKRKLVVSEADDSETITFEIYKLS